MVDCPTCGAPKMVACGMDALGRAYYHTQRVGLAQSTFVAEASGKMYRKPW